MRVPHAIDDVVVPVPVCEGAGPSTRSANDPSAGREIWKVKPTLAQVPALRGPGWLALALGLLAVDLAPRVLRRPE